MNLLLKNNITTELSARNKNILRSPKKGGSSKTDSVPYLKELGIQITENLQPIQFTPNINEHIHRWAPYVQGFSASFVQSIFEKYRNDYENPIIFDPFAGCGTVLVQAKLNGYRSFGVELNPLLQFIANTKLNCWDISSNYLLKTYNDIPNNIKSSAPSFLKSKSHFNTGVLQNLEIIKGGIESLKANSIRQKKAVDLVRVAFSSILIDCSNLKRTPCLGYWKNKKVPDSAPFGLFNQKICEIAADLEIIKRQYRKYINTESQIILANSMEYCSDNKYDIVITSPPYMNGLDYVINYKIEMGWLGFARNHKELKMIKDDLVVCDNVSKGLIEAFSYDKTAYSNDWIEDIKTNIRKNIRIRGGYRREDMPSIVHKYFDDLYRVMRNVTKSLNEGGRFILVVGDSLIADVYVPTDLLIAKIGLDLGLNIEKIEIARERRSGQIRSYKLRETIVTLKKGQI